MLASKDLISQTIVTIIVAKIETSVGVEVLDNEFETNVAGSRTHGLQLSGDIVASEYATVVVAGVVDEAACFFFVGPGLTGCEASCIDALQADGEHASQGSEENSGLHFGEERCSRCNVGR